MAIFNKFKILIFDENIFMGQLLNTILSSFGAKDVTLVNSLSEAQSLGEKMYFNCIFADLNGMEDPKPELLNFIRCSGKAADPTASFIVYSGRTTLNEVLKCRELGCSEYLTKPVSPSHVFDKLYSACYGKRDFIAVENFTGPDRRRSSNTNFAGFERRKDNSMTQQEIDDLLEEA